MFGWPLMDLFATRANAEPSLYMPLVSDPMAWKQDAFSISGTILLFIFFPNCSSQSGLESTALNQSLGIMAASFWLQKEWFSDLVVLLVEEPLEFPMRWNLVVHPHVRSFIRP